MVLDSKITDFDIFIIKSTNFAGKFDSIKISLSSLEKMNRYSRIRYTQNIFIQVLIKFYSQNSNLSPNRHISEQFGTNNVLFLPNFSFQIFESSDFPFFLLKRIIRICSSHRTSFSCLNELFYISISQFRWRHIEPSLPSDRQFISHLNEFAYV